MARVFTSGRWLVKPGQEQAFVDAWREFAEWSRARFDAAQWVVLLQDREHPNQFTSVGPWESEAAIEAWRGDEGSRSRIARVRELLDGFDPSTLDPVVELE